MSKIGKICLAIKPHSYMDENPLAHYHAAKKVRNAMMRHDIFNRVQGVREALKHYGILVSINESGDKVLLRVNGNLLMVL